MRSTTLIPLLSLLPGLLAAPLPQSDEPATGAKCSTFGAVKCSSDARSVWMCDRVYWIKLADAPTGTKCVNGFLASDAGGIAAPAPAPTMAPPMMTPPMMTPPMMTPPADPPASGDDNAGADKGSPPSDAAPTATGTGGSDGSNGDGDAVPAPIKTPESPPAPPMGIPTSTDAAMIALPSATPGGSPPGGAMGGSSVTAEQVLAAAPKSSSCGSDGQFAAECRTNDVAAKAISQSFSKYGIMGMGEKAALLSLMAFETGDFKFERNHFPEPGRPGQGTRNLMMPNFVFEYVQSIDSLKGKLATAAPGITSGDQLSNANGDVKNAVLQLVLSPDELSFGSAAWFLTAKCDKSVRDQLNNGGEAGWENYITSCVGTTVTDERKAGFQKALAALGGK